MRYLLALPAASLLVLLAACGGAGTSTPAAPAVTAAEALDRAAAAVDNLKSFRFLLTHENAGSAITFGLEMTEAEGEIIVPERMHAKIQAKAAGIKVNVETIAVGDRVWITNPFNRQWQELPGGISGNALFNPATGVSAALRGVSGAAIGTGERIDGAETYLVEGEVDASRLSSFAPAAEEGLTVHVEVWMRTDDFVPLRMRLVGPLSQEEPENIARELELSGFDREYRIEPPSVS